jgi:hypothetical protein
MKKLSHFQRITRQCKFLIKRLKGVKDALSQATLKQKLEKLIAKHQSNERIRRLVFGLIISAFPLNEMNGQTIDFNDGVEKGFLRPLYWGKNQSGKNINLRGGGSINYSNLNSLDIDQDGDKDFLFISNNPYSNPKHTLLFAKNAWNNSSPIFQLEEINETSIITTSNIAQLVLDPYNYTSFEFINFDIDGDTLKDLVVINRENNFIKVFKQNIVNDSIKFDTLPIFEIPYEEGISLIDINGDGNIDKYLGNSTENGKLLFFINTGNNNTPIFDDLNPVEIITPNEEFSYKLDYDNDGDLDLGFTTRKDLGEYQSVSYANFLVNESDGDNIVFSKIDTFAKVSPPLYSYSISLKMNDIDTDGDLDLISTYFYSCPSPGCYSSFVNWIKNDFSNFKVKGEIKNGDGEGFLIPLIVEPENKVKWPIIDFENELYTSNFSFSLNPGFHKIYPRLPENWSSTPEYLELTALEGIDSTTYQNFIVQIESGTEDFSIQASTFNVARSGFEHNQSCKIFNNSDKPQSLVFAWKPDNRLEIVSISESYDSLNNGIYYFTVNTNPLSNTSLNYIVKVPTDVQIGDTLKSYFSITPENDNDASNNSFELIDVVVGSWDPNDKIVSPEGIGDKGITDIENKAFTYTIRFQNTGNYMAENVVLIDTIDEKFDMKTFKTLNIPYNPYISSETFIDKQIIEINGNVVKYVFQGINLPPQSEDEFESQGYVQYSIKLKEGIQSGAIIKNKADIYFDFNNPITTNETINELAIISKVTQQGLPKISSKIYPNPTKNKALLEWDKTISEEMVLSMYDINGKLLISKIVNGGFASINVQDWSNGVYIYVLESQMGNAWGKLVVE